MSLSARPPVAYAPWQSDPLRWISWVVGNAAIRAKKYRADRFALDSPPVRCADLFIAAATIGEPSAQLSRGWWIETRVPVPVALDLDPEVVDFVRPFVERYFDEIVVDTGRPERRRDAYRMMLGAGALAVPETYPKLRLGFGRDDGVPLPPFDTVRCCGAVGFLEAVILERGLSFEDERRLDRFGFDDVILACGVEGGRLVYERSSPADGWSGSHRAWVVSVREQRWALVLDTVREKLVELYGAIPTTRVEILDAAKLASPSWSRALFALARCCGAYQ